MFSNIVLQRGIFSVIIFAGFVLASLETIIFNDQLSSLRQEMPNFCERSVLPVLSSPIVLNTPGALEALFKRNLLTGNYYHGTVVTCVKNVDEAMVLINAFSRSIDKAPGGISKEKIRQQWQIFVVVHVNRRADGNLRLNEFREKLRPEIAINFDLTSSVMIASMYEEIINITTNPVAGNRHRVKFDVWEVQSIKNVSFFQKIGNRLDGSALHPFLMLESRRVSRRQDWHGVEISVASFMSSGKFGGDNDFLEIEGVTKYEVNLRRSLTTGTPELKRSLSARILWDFEVALNFTSKKLVPFQYSSGFGNVFTTHGHLFDLVISHFTLVPQRLKHAQHLEPTYFDGITAFFAQPPTHMFRNIYVTPFSKGMWVMYFLTWVTISLSFQVVSWVRRHQMGGFALANELERNDELVAKECFLWTVAASCQQGWYVTPSTTSSRAIFATGLLFSYLCYAAYTATIVSELWATRVPIRTFETLIELSNAIYVERDSDVAAIVIEQMKDPSVASKIRARKPSRSVFNHMIDTSRGQSCFLNWADYFIADAKKQFRNGAGDPSKVERNVEVYFCELFSRFHYRYIPVGGSMFVHKASPFRKIFNFRILIGLERGLIRRYWYAYQRIVGIQCLVDGNKTYPLGIFDAWAAFSVLFTGYAVSLATADRNFSA